MRLPPTARHILSIVICALMTSSVALLLALPNAGSVGEDPALVVGVMDLSYGGFPDITSGAPASIALIGHPYSYDAECSAPDNGVVNWTLETNASWLAVASGGDGFQYCNLFGIPGSTGVFWARLSVNDSDSMNSLNWTVRVNEPGLWGGVETLSDLKTGTHDPNTLALAYGNLSLIDSSPNQESVILDGALMTYSRASMDNVTIITYEPNWIDDGLGWNFSVEVYPTREDSDYRWSGKPSPKIGLMVYLCNGTERMAGVQLYVGSPAQGFENIRLYNATSNSTSLLADDIIPSYINRHDDHPEGTRLSDAIYGEAPDHYTVSFRYVAGSKNCAATVIHTSAGVVGSSIVEMPSADIPAPLLRFDSDFTITDPAVFTYWVIDNIGFRGLNARYPNAEPLYEYVFKGGPVWITVKDPDGGMTANAIVEIDAQPATYNSTSKRYEAVLDLPVNWSKPIDAKIVADGVELTKKVKVTTMPRLQPDGMYLPLWWNGWDWVSVFGRDDSTSSTSSPEVYSAYNHPATSYVMTSPPGGTSNGILATQSEIGLHQPHDYLNWPRKFWDEAVVSASSGHATLENYYTFASRWDNPAYVGKGDTYISIANPGNSGSWEQLFAQFERGTRIMGFTSNPWNVVPGNTSFIGAWWVPEQPHLSASWSPPYSKWYAYTPYDMMDIIRGPPTDIDLRTAEWQNTFWAAQHGGVRRIYNHGSISATASVFLSWVDNPKTNFSLENWKATDGEVASYVYGRWTTDVAFNSTLSNETISAYDIARIDPATAGYWRVPITVSFNISGRDLRDVEVVEGSRTLRMSDNSLHNLSAKRVMDVGYDIRGERVYVSYFWNESTSLRFLFGDKIVIPNTAPSAAFMPSPTNGNMTTVFWFDASSSNDLEDPLSALQFRWDWNGDGIWDTSWSSDPIAQHQYTDPDRYTVRVEVMDSGGLTTVAEGYVEVSAIEVPEFSSLAIVVVGTIVAFGFVFWRTSAGRKR